MIKLFAILSLILCNACSIEKLENDIVEIDNKISICQRPSYIEKYRNINKSDYHYIEASIKEIEKLDIEYFREGQNYCQLLKLEKNQYCILFLHSTPSPGGDLEICHNSKDNNIIEYRLGE